MGFRNMIDYGLETIMMVGISSEKISSRAYEERQYYMTCKTHTHTHTHTHAHAHTQAHTHIHIFLLHDVRVTGTCV